MSEMDTKDTDNVVEINEFLIKKIARSVRTQLKAEHPEITAKDFLNIEWTEDDFDDDD
jgi:hypothetical protein